MINTANIEIVEPFVRLGPSGSDDGCINLDESTSRSLYALAWEKFDAALAKVNEVYDLADDPGESHKYQYNRVTRLLWEITDLKQVAEVIFSMTAIPEDDGTDV